MSKDKVVSFLPRQHKAAAKRRTRNLRQDAERGAFVLAPMYWAFLLWQRLRVDDLDAEMRAVLADALVGALRAPADGSASCSVVLPREIRRYVDSDLALLAQARNAFERETAEAAPAVPSHEPARPDMVSPEALLESGIMTEKHLQAAREAIEREVESMGVDMGGNPGAPSTRSPPTRGKPRGRGKRR